MILYKIYFTASVRAYLNDDYYYSAEEETDLHNVSTHGTISKPLRRNISEILPNAAITTHNLTTDVRNQTSATNREYELFYGSQNAENEVPIEKYLEVLNNVNSSEELVSVEDIFKSSKNTEQIDLERVVTSTSDLETTTDISSITAQYVGKNIRDERIEEILEKLQANKGDAFSKDMFIKYYKTNVNNQNQIDNVDSSTTTESTIIKKVNNDYLDDILTQENSQTELPKINYHLKNANKAYLDYILGREITTTSPGLTRTDDNLRGAEIDPAMYDYEAHSKEIDSISTKDVISTTEDEKTVSVTKNDWMQDKSSTQASILKKENAEEVKLLQETEKVDNEGKEIAVTNKNVSQYVLEIVGAAVGTIVVIASVLYAYKKFKTKSYDTKEPVA